MTQLNVNAQPKTLAFNYSRNKQKSLFGLKGLLVGITADEKLNEQELLFLDVWLRSQNHLKNDSDVIDLLDSIGDILQDQVITNDELIDLNGLINSVIEYKEWLSEEKENQINELTGLIAGIAADNVVLDSEILALSQWLTENPEIKDSWPANKIIDRLNNILEDGIITQEEREDLLETINQITGIRFEEDGIAHGLATEFFEDTIEQINHNNNSFCFTGSFVSGIRKIIEQSARNKGAVIKKDVTANLDYLVIGTIASRDWRFTSHGRKIEKALKFKEQGKQINIITERTWLNLLKR